MKKLIFLVGLLLFASVVQLNSDITHKIWVPSIEATEAKYTKHIFDKPESLLTYGILLDPKQKHCLALNIYFEAAVESTAGKLAVAQVTLNRVNSERYPETICGVIYEGPHTANGFPKRDMCQFSWYCDGKHDNPNEGKSWKVSQKIAEYILQNPGMLDITDSATHYYADYIPAPRWANARDKTVKIDTHIFYNKTNKFKY
jgi:spore germination cell wall hydrolase CwlJ-like protein